MDNRWLTKQQIADLSGVTVGKVKYYIKNFSEYFKEHFPIGSKHPVYDSESVEIVKLIASMIRSNNHDDIRRALFDNGYYPVIDVPEETDGKTIAQDDSKNSLATHQLPSTGTSIQSIADTLSALNQIIDVQADTIRNQKRVIDDLRQQLDDD